MAGTITADFIRADANRLSLQVGNTVFASINAMGLLSNTGNVWVSQTGAITANNISVGRIVTPSVMPANSILQIVQTVKNDNFSLSGGTWTDVTGFNVSITPTSASSKILVMFSGYVNQSTTSGTYGIMLRIVRNSTNISIGNLRASEQQASAQIGSNSSHYAQCLMGTYLDSPATTSSITYKMQMYVESGGTGHIGGSYTTSNAYNASVPSQILVMEIAQ
jgi:hypothetical protein